MSKYQQNIPPPDYNSSAPQPGFQVPPGPYPGSPQTGPYPGPPGPPMPQQGNVPYMGQMPIQGQPGTTNVMIAPHGGMGMMYGNMALPPNEARITCPSCHEVITTKVDYKASTRTHMLAGLMCLMMCWLCCWIPYVTKSCKNANHYCPSCGCFIGTALNV